MHDASYEGEAGWEIERKFLVKEPPDDLDRYPHAEIVQGYLALAAAGTVVRIRRRGDRYVQTVKQGAGRRRREVEIPLSRDQFEALWPLTEGRRVEKVRYEIPHADYLIELDVYRGLLAGLTTAEVEFVSLEESAAFSPPPWFGREVTEDERYANNNLAVHGLPGRERES